MVLCPWPTSKCVARVSSASAELLVSLSVRFFVDRLLYASVCVWVIRACTFVCQIKRASSGDWDTAEYSSFSISDGTDKYRLNVNGYSGTAGDAIVNPSVSSGVSNGMMFTTRDQDNDKNAAGNCGTLGGWWFNDCSKSALNINVNGMWDATGSERPVTHSRMWLEAPGSVTFILFVSLFVCHVHQGSRGYMYFCVQCWVWFEMKWFEIMILNQMQWFLISISNHFIISDLWFWYEIIFWWFYCFTWCQNQSHLKSFKIYILS